MRCQFVPEAPQTGIVDDDDAGRESIRSTASGNDHERKEALEHGAVAFLDKPFGDETLLNVRLALVQ